MAELGWAAVPFPEAHGGLDFGYKGLGVVTEETGRNLVASPLFASVWLCGTAINVGGSDAQKGGNAAAHRRRRTAHGLGAGGIPPP